MKTVGWMLLGIFGLLGIIASGLALLSAVDSESRARIATVGVVFGIALALGIKGLARRMSRNRLNAIGVKYDIFDVLAVIVLVGTIAVPSGASAQSWVGEVYSKKPAPVQSVSMFVQLCSRFQSFYGIWKSTNERKSEAPALGRDLLKVFDQSREERVKAEPCVYVGRYTLDFASGPQVVDVVVSVLLRGDLVPKHIDKTPKQLRDMVVKDLLAQVQEMRKQGGDAWLPGSRGVQAIELGMRKFNITAEELRLNSDEVGFFK